MLELEGKRGITLIALVITVIILLILAGIVISLAIGENGIIKKAGQAGEEYKLASIRENVELGIMDCKTQSILTQQEITVESVLQELVEKNIFESIDKEEQIGNIDIYEVKLGYDENHDVIIESIQKATGVRFIYNLDPVGYTNQAKVGIIVRITGAVRKSNKTRWNGSRCAK